MLDVSDMTNVTRAYHSYLMASYGWKGPSRIYQLLRDKQPAPWNIFLSGVRLFN